MIHAASAVRGPGASLLAVGLLAAALLATAPFATGCRDRPSAGAGPPRASELAIGYADPRPRASRERGISTIITHLTSERLVSLARDGRAEAALAERWTESPDGLTWRFTLREGLRLHDGSPLDAAVVRASLMSAIDGAGGTAALVPGLRSVTGVDAVGAREVAVRLSRPDALLLEGLTEVQPRGGQGGTQSAGPFRLVSRDQEGVVFSAFRQYYRGAPRLERIHIREFPSARNAWVAMMRGEIDFLYDVPPEALDFVEQSSTALVATFLRPYATALVFNGAHPVLGRQAVRVALNAGVNRAEVIKVALRGRGQPATDHVWPKHWAYDASQPRFDFDPGRATALLAAQGLRANAARGRRARFTFTCLVPTDDPRFEQVALLVQRQLIEIGVDMRLDAVPVPVLQQRIAAGEYDAFLFELGSSPGLQWVYWFWHSSPGAPFMKPGYHAANAALDRVRDSRTDEDRRGAIRALRQVMHANPPAVFLYWNETTRAVSRRFEIPRVPDRDILVTVAQWRLARPASE